jgi:hypothetical protein
MLLSEVMKLIDAVKRASPRAFKSAGVRRAARNAIRAAARAELAGYNDEASDGSSEDKEWLQDEDLTNGRSDMASTLEKLLGRPPKST